MKVQLVRPQIAPEAPQKGEVLLWVTKTRVNNGLSCFLPLEQVRRAGSPGASSALAFTTLSERGR